jgi:glutaminyl-peptide cyclotransferase
MKRIFGLALLPLLVVACKNNTSTDKEDSSAISTIAPPANITYNILASYPHDTSSFTQGLEWINDTLYEGTGLEGQSRLMRVDLNTGKANKSISLDPSIFGEGITLLNGKIYELTWQNHKVYVYDAKTFQKIKEFSWEHEGWGITNNGKDLIVSTGSSNLYFVDPETFKEKNIIGVADNNGPVGNLNELEYVDGVVYANIYLTDYIVKIDPSNGHIIGKLNLSGLLQNSGKSYNPETTDVLNGIAYNANKKTFYITGKKWPTIFEMKLQ